MEKLFAYGTLCDPATQERLLGRLLGDGVPDTLRGYMLSRLRGIHDDYTIVQPKAGSTVSGRLYEVTHEELELLDTYEGDAYQRVSVTLMSKTRAWLYCENPRSRFSHHIEPLESK
ncbi:MAG: gamma-glutamylcyclotransferase [Chloroflexi bacterium]|nr:gamma-glutamylcyclotransferase [Chloroflexota bacterium]